MAGEGTLRWPSPVRVFAAVEESIRRASESVPVGCHREASTARNPQTPAVIVNVMTEAVAMICCFVEPTLSRR